MYDPPAFQLYEFDDGSPSAIQPARRWLSNWMALDGNPADEVVLAWSPGAGTVVTVGTSDRSHQRELLRHVCAVQALGGGDLPIPAKLEPPAAVHQEIDRIVAADDLWRPLSPMLSGASEGEACELGGYALGYCYIDHGPALTVAAAGVPVASFKVRTVRDWGHYNIDASKRHPLAELDAARQEHDNTR
jgi:hypothetical protein